MKLVDAVFGTLLYITTMSSRSSSLPLRTSACPSLFLASIRATASSGKKIALFLLNSWANRLHLNTYEAIYNSPPGRLIAAADRLWQREGSKSEPIAQMASSSVSSYVAAQTISVTHIGHPRACRVWSRSAKARNICRAPTRDLFSFVNTDLFFVKRTPVFISQRSAVDSRQIMTNALCCKIFFCYFLVYFPTSVLRLQPLSEVIWWL